MDRIDKNDLNEFKKLIAHSKKAKGAKPENPKAEIDSKVQNSEISENLDLEVLRHESKKVLTHIPYVAPKRGRPSKRKDERTQKKTIYLSPEELEFIRVLPFGRGLGTKVKKIISEYKF